MKKNKYTLTEDKEVEQVIDFEVRAITQALRDIAGDKIVSIWLIGGFGRGEGGVEQIENKLLPKNNYDFLIVIDKKMITRKWRFSMIKKVEEMTKGIISVPIEISFQSLKSIKKAKNIMIYRDIYNASLCLYGTSAKHLIEYDNNVPLPKIEAMRVIRNRGMLLMASEDNLGHYGYIADEKQKMIWRSKAIIGYADAILIMRKSYLTSYAKKNQKIQELDLHDILNPFQALFFKKLMTEATEYRLFGKQHIEILFDSEVVTILGRIHAFVMSNSSYDAPNTTKKLLTFISNEGLLRTGRNILYNLKNLKLFKNSFCFLHPRDHLNFVTPYLFYGLPIPVEIRTNLNHLDSPEKALKGYVEHLV